MAWSVAGIDGGAGVRGGRIRVAGEARREGEDGPTAGICAVDERSGGINWGL